LADCAHAATDRLSPEEPAQAGERLPGIGVNFDIKSEQLSSDAHVISLTGEGDGPASAIGVLRG
jgi:hypothetical protein